eukprot:SAG31_NODE_1108_length_9862_cov_5.407662_5_plen_74_part_00
MASREIIMVHDAVHHKVSRKIARLQRQAQTLYHECVENSVASNAPIGCVKLKSKSYYIQPLHAFRCCRPLGLL